MPRVVPVLDLQGRRVVHAIAGDRANYRPLVSSLVTGCESADVAKALRRFNSRELYVADLDAIGGGEPAWDLYPRMAHDGVRLWLDVGVRDEADIERLLQIDPAGDCVGGVIVALETLGSLDLLPSIVERLGAERIVFSLDLRDGRCVTASGVAADPLSIARQAIQSGVRRMIVLDLTDVGRSEGASTLALCEKIRTLADESTVPLELIAGGGVRGQDDLARLGQAGCDAALVSTALHRGWPTAGD